MFAASDYGYRVEIWRVGTIRRPVRFNRQNLLLQLVAGAVDQFIVAYSAIQIVLSPSSAAVTE